MGLVQELCHHIVQLARGDTEILPVARFSAALETPTHVISQTLQGDPPCKRWLFQVLAVISSRAHWPRPNWHAALLLNAVTSSVSMPIHLRCSGTTIKVATPHRRR